MEIKNPFIFRNYDIRGVADSDLPDKDVIAIGKAFGTRLIRQGKRDINVGRDCRLSSERLYKSLVQGIFSTGCTIRNLGICTTPMLYFSLFCFNADGGIMITGSHNPPEYNGFKLCVGQDSLDGEKLQELRQMIEADDFHAGTGDCFTGSVTEAYLEYLSTDCVLDRPLTIVIDSGNGVAGTVAIPLFKKLGCTVIPLFEKPDGRFPNHVPNPLKPENMAACVERVVNEKADFGIAYDCDGDRLGVVDDKGKILWGDSLMILFAREILSRKPNALFISEVTSSQSLYDEISRLGGTVIMGKMGHTNIKAKMKEMNAALGAELSGHIFFNDGYLGFDDAIYATRRLLEIVAASDTPLSELLSDITPLFSTPEIRIPVPDEEKFRIAQKVTDHFKKENYSVIDIDGCRVNFKDGWGLVRASNTQPALTMRFEAISEDALHIIEKTVRTVVDEVMS
ncbi:MAG: phosphomannomutase/phosphoglucomutase [Candidatus Omnitrophica bacterium]|nr:phosphomannomutase/phosphoglucomutase [Candidatus Omnitrophota bacterium]